MVNVSGNLATQAWFPADAIITIESKGSDEQRIITTEVTNFSDGGGAKETESVPHFGNAFLVIQKPQEDFEVEYEISVVDTTWFEAISGDVTETAGSFRIVRSGGTQNPYKVKVEWLSPSTDEAYKILYFNAFAVTFEKDNAADDRLTGTISFNVAPQDANGSPQRMELETIDITDEIVGSSVGGAGSGLYGSFEEIFDTLYGYGVGSML